MRVLSFPSRHPVRALARLATLTAWAALAGAGTGHAQEPATLDVAPSRLSFLGGERADRLPAQSVQVRNIGGGQLVWRAHASEPWVILSPDRATAPAVLLVAVNAQMLTPGRHAARVVVESAGAQRSPQAIEVAVTISSSRPVGPPALQAVPDRVSFAAPLGQAEPLTFAVRVQAEQNAAIRWTARTDKTWLAVSPREGTTPTQVTLSALPASLAEGDHTATVSISTGANAPVLRIPVSFTVKPTGGRFAFVSTSLPAAILNLPYEQALQVKGGRPPYAVQLAGILPPELGLVNGVIRGTPRTPGTFAFTLIARDSADPPATVTETLTLPVVVLDQTTALVVEPGEVRLAASRGSAPNAATLNVTAGGPPLTWRASADATWVQIEPTSGAAPSTFTIGATTAGLKPGTYTATVTVSMQGVPNSPIAVPVQLVVK